MSQVQGQHKSSLVNGVNRRRGDHDLGSGPHDYQSNRIFRSPSSTFMGVGQLGHHVNNHISANAASASQSASISKDMVGSKEMDKGGLLNEHLMHLTACLIGQPVEVQVKCGAIYAGIFHTGNAGKDHGIVLKMARLIKQGSSKGKNDLSKDLAVRPQKKYIIYAKDLVQIIAKDVPLRGETMQNGRLRENRVEIITDSLLSQGRHGELERELEPWTPDTDVPKDLGLDSTFDNTFYRNWDQFEINRTLFGIRSTFDEELYTTKLEKGPQMREREREALRIAREIEGESAKNVHLAEERGLHLSRELELLDEESRFSSVLRTHEDAGEDCEDVNIDVHNDDTFASSVTQVAAASAKVVHNSATSGEAPSGGGNQPPLADPKKEEPVPASASEHSTELMQEEKPLHVTVGDWSKHSPRVGGFPSPRPSSMIGDTTNLQALDLDPGSPHVTKDVYRDFNEFKQQENAKRGRQHREEQVNELKSFSKSLQELAMSRQHTSNAAGRKTAGACAPPASALPFPTSITNSISTPVVSNDGAVLAIPLSKTAAGEVTRSMSNDGGGFYPPDRPSTSGACSSPFPSATSAYPPQVPSSPAESSTKKSMLNPHAKEFKLNPNAKSFTPNFSPLRPPSPVVQGSTYASGTLQQLSSMQSVPMGAAGNPVPPQPAGQPTKYTPYSNAAVGGAPTSGTSFFPSPAIYTSTSAPMLPTTGKPAAKAPPPQLHQPASFGAPQPVRYAPQAPVLQAVPTYLHPGGHLYPQQMMFGQPGQVFYFQPFPQGPPMPPPPPPATSGAPQQMQSNLRGPGMQEMQGCLAPPHIAAGQHFLPQLPSPMQSAPSILAPPTLPNIQPSQSVGGPVVPQTVSVSGANSGTSMMRPGGIVGAST